MYSAWGDVRVVEELRGAEQEGEELVVIEAPDPVGAGRFEIVGHLYGTHEAKITWEDAEDESSRIATAGRIGFEDVELAEAEEPHEEVELVTRAVVDAATVAKRVVEVDGRFVDGGVVGEAERAVPCSAAGVGEVEEAAEGFVTKAGTALLVGGGLQDELFCFV